MRRVCSFVVITGMSGAGRTSAAHNLEDLGWFVMDNLPPSLMSAVASWATTADSGADRIALVVGTGRYHDHIQETINDLREQVHELRVLFLKADTDTLVRRYESSRRRHPFDDASTLNEAIDAERAALEPTLEAADVVIDTTDLNVHELRDRIGELFKHESDAGMRVTVMSFGYAHGLPRDVDVVIDCRFLANPHWQAELRPLTGLDARVAAYVKSQPVAAHFTSGLESLLKLMLPYFVSEGKAYLAIAFGCTGGRHRSVAVAEHFAEVLRSLGHDPSVKHRDIHAT